MNDLPTARALAYDMVYSGVEVVYPVIFLSFERDSYYDLWPFNFFMYHQIGGGSLRIYKREVQQKVLEIVGISPEQVRIPTSILHYGWLE